MNAIINLITKEQFKKYGVFILQIVIFNVILSVGIAYISHNFLDSVLAKNTTKWESATEEFIIVVLFAPFLETLFLQVATYSIIAYVTGFLKLTSQTNDKIFIILSSGLFAAMHTYNWLYVCSAFIGGLSLNYSYAYFKKEKFYPFPSVVCIHILYNLSVLLIKTAASA